MDWILNRIMMIANYLKTALRNLNTHRSYALISIFGLGIGMAAFIVLFLVVRFETSFDTFHKDTGNIYRVVTVIHFPDGAKYAGDIPTAVPQGLRMDYPQLRDVTALIGEYDVALEPLAANAAAGGKDAGAPRRFKEKQGVFWAEPAFLKLFSFPLLAGDPGTALSLPHTALLTRSTAERYFGNWKTAIGRSLKAWNGDLFTITGILEDPPANTDFPIRALLSYKTLQGVGYMNDWAGLSGGSYCFLRLPPGLSPTQFNRELESFSHRHKPAQWQIERHLLQPLSAMHFDGDYSTYTGAIFPRPLITALWGIAVFLLLIACINFINFSTARALIRSREIGIRKILGGSRGQLVFQLFNETALITAAGLVFAIGLTLVAIPALDSLLDLSLSLTMLLSPAVWGSLLLLWLCVTLLSGTYPALVLSGFRPIAAIKEQVAAGGIFLRKALVVFQFTFAQLLVIAIVVITSQINFFRHAPLGFDKDNVLNIPIPQDSANPTKLVAFRQQLSELSGVRSISFCFDNPAAQGWQKIPFQFDGSSRNSDFDASVKWADTAYFQTYGLRLIAGHAYAPADTTTGFVVNETLLRKEHLIDPKAAIGKTIRLGGGPPRPIVGVVMDFATTSLRNPIDPVILATNQSSYRLAGIKLQTADITPLVAEVSRLWKQTWPAKDFEFDFLDKRIAAFYQREEAFAQLFRIFTAIAVLISCLGLYALAAFMTARRRKEVAVRKVLGASIKSVVYLFVREFTLPVLLAFVIAAPIATFILRRWLDGYAYRIQLGPAIFTWSLTISIAIAWTTIGSRVLASAYSNPVQYLRG